MSPLVTIAALDVAAAFLLGAIFGTLSRGRGHDRHLRLWAIAWTVLGASQVLSANDLLGRPIPHVHVLLPPLGVASILFLVAGTYRFVGRRYHHGWTAAAVVAGAATAALEAAGVGPFQAAVPPILLLVVAIFSAATALLRLRPHGGSYRFAAAAMYGWALNTLTYPFLAPHELAAPIGTGLSAFFQIATGIGLLLTHLERGRRRLEEAAEEERARIAQAPVGVFRTSPDERFLLANPAALALLDYPDLESLQAAGTVAEVFAEGDHRDVLAELVAHVDGVETSWRRRDGTVRRVWLRGRAVRDDDGELRYIEGFASDVTAQRRLQQQLESARRLQTVGRLTGGIAHDFNNLLMVIQGNLDLAARGNDADAIPAALEATSRAASLTGQLLRFARAQESEEAATDIATHVEVLAKLLKRTLPESVALTVEHEGEGHCVAAAPASTVDQILLNLVVNARDALAGARGSVAVRTRCTEDARGHWTVIEVQDDGPGLDPAVASNIFEPFVSTRAVGEGSGLGLTIVRDLVEAASGRVEVESAPGEGACFRVYLPERTEEPPQVERSSVPPRPGRGTVLVVDDEPSVLRITAKLLGRHGYEVITADGVASARALLGPELTVLLSDVVLADGNGFELVELVEERGWDLPCLLMSGYPDAVARGRDQPDVPLLAKPFTTERLLSEVERLIDERRVGANETA